MTKPGSFRRVAPLLVNAKIKNAPPFEAERAFLIRYNLSCMACWVSPSLAIMVSSTCMSEEMSIASAAKS